MDQKISDLDVAISMSASDLIPIVDSNGDNKVLHGSQVKDYVADAVVSDIDDVKAMISDAYDNTATYAVGDYCIYNDTLYRCTTDISTPEDFNPAHWTVTSIADEIGRIDTALSGKANVNAALNCKQIHFDSLSVVVPGGTIRDLFYNQDISGNLPSGAKLKAIIVEETTPTSLIARQWVNSDTSCSIRVGNAGSSITVTDVYFRALYTLS